MRSRTHESVRSRYVRALRARSQGRDLLRNAALVVGGLVFWLTCAPMGLGGDAFFVPLAVVSLLVPALLAAFASGGLVLRVVVLAAPSLVVVAVLAAHPDLIGGWSVLAQQIILGGLVVVLIGFLSRAVVQRWMASRSAAR